MRERVRAWFSLAASGGDCVLVRNNEDETKSESSKVDSTSDEESVDSGDGPDTSSFTAFLFSLLSSSEDGGNSDKKNDYEDDLTEESDVPVLRDSGRRKSLFSRGKQSLGRVIHQAAKLGGFRSQASHKVNSDMVIDSASNSHVSEEVMKPVQPLEEPMPSKDPPEVSEPSLLLSEKTRTVLYAAMPVIVQGRKWLLLYSTWRHGISLSTLYRRSMLWPGLSLLVVGDRKGAVFGGMVEAPLRPTNKRRYQGNKDSFVFTNISGDPEIFRPTGANRYFTLCSTEYLAMGGGSHFALYLDGDLLTGSSSASETYGNSHLAHTEDFDVKEVELWGFVYASKYEEMVSILRTEAPGICRW
ncbi:hypothetical protein M9H77_19739 [Catharanthus roseus]|uniref:Uncharacterized protein n=1 Tax=Catharanthus roseus TaxID=4058 RepID=A0ACC0BB59_CATRO|nr:hypothetical protein M9H77_19739 [Catharanthus roseus]